MPTSPTPLHSGMLPVPTTAVSVNRTGLKMQWSALPKA
jgi:hypothetical protein